MFRLQLCHPLLPRGPATSRRSLKAAAAALLVHAGALALVVLAGTGGEPSSTAEVAAVELRAIRAPDPVAVAIARPEFALDIVSVDVAPPVFAIAEPQVGPPAGSDPSSAADCDPFTRVRETLEADSARIDLLSAAPPHTRSIAGAIIVWNRQWAPVTDPRSGALARVRHLIEATLAGLPATCLQGSVLGPRLIALPTARGTDVLVIGSGRWEWASLLPADAPQELFSAG